MLLVVDIGNTNIVIGAFKGEELLFEFRLKTDPGRTIDEYSALLCSLIDRKLGAGAKFSECVISSVVPPLTNDLVRLVEESFGVQPLVVGPGIKTGLSIKIANPSTVGADRVVNAVAAKVLFGTPALVIDFGTGTTFDYISKDGSYKGGVICPGAYIALDALVKNTAKLPRIEFAWPKSFVGRDTISAMQAGAVGGYVCMVDGIVDRMIQELGPIEHIVATGGLGRVFSAHSARIKRYDPHLTLKGMKILADLNRSES